MGKEERRGKKPIKKSFVQNLIAAADKLRDEFLKFLYLTIVAIIVGSTWIAVAYGRSGGIVLITLIMLFVLAALYLYACYFK